MKGVTKLFKTHMGLINLTILMFQQRIFCFVSGQRMTQCQTAVSVHPGSRDCPVYRRHYGVRLILISPDHDVYHKPFNIGTGVLKEGT